MGQYSLAEPFKLLRETQFDKYFFGWIIIQFGGKTVYRKLTVCLPDWSPTCFINHGDFRRKNPLLFSLLISIVVNINSIRRCVYTNNYYWIPVHIYTRTEQLSIRVSLQFTLVQPHHQIQEDVADGHVASPASMHIFHRWTLPTNNGTFSKCKSHLSISR
jgi:hypothetical protein